MMNNCEYCLCQNCIFYDDCDPCSGDFDYEHPCSGDCDEYEPVEYRCKYWKKEVNADADSD